MVTSAFQYYIIFKFSISFSGCPENIELKPSKTTKGTTCLLLFPLNIYFFKCFSLPFTNIQTQMINRYSCNTTPLFQRLEYKILHIMVILLYDSDTKYYLKTNKITMFIYSFHYVLHTLTSNRSLDSKFSPPHNTPPDPQN